MANKGVGVRLAHAITGEHELIDRDSVVEFEFEGRSVSAYDGDTIGSAVTAVGIDILSRSFKYHRPRGLLCASGNCPNCLMNVDGIPNVRACTMKVRAGMKVTRQNAWPSVDHDFGSLLDRMDRFLPVGFYYKVFHKPKILWEIMRPIVRRIAGLGRVDISSDGGPTYSHRNGQTDLAVVGGGPAGMMAALMAADAGLDVTLIDQGPKLGGHLLYDTTRYVGIDGVVDGTGQEIAASLRERALGHDGIRVMSGANAFGCYEDNLIAIQQGYQQIQLRADRVVMANGAIEVPFPFENNDRPGVVLANGAMLMARLYGVPVGKRAVVATVDDSGYATALSLLDVGIEVAVVVDGRAAPGSTEASEAVRAAGVEVLVGHRVAWAGGRKRVSRPPDRKQAPSQQPPPSPCSRSESISQHPRAPAPQAPNPIQIPYPTSGSTANS